MVLQYKKKTATIWTDYPGKGKVEGSLRSYDFRLLSKDKKKVLVKRESYDKVMKRFRQIEFFKHKG